MHVQCNQSTWIIRLGFFPVHSLRDAQLWCDSSVGQRVILWSDHIRDLAGLQIQVTAMASYGIISLGKKLTHNCLSRLRSINEYLVFDWGGKDLRLRAPGQAPGDCLAQPIAPAWSTGTQPSGWGYYRLMAAPYPFAILPYWCGSTNQTSSLVPLIVYRVTLICCVP